MSSSINISRIFYGLATICILLFAFFSLKEMHNVSGWLLMAFFLSVAFAFRGSKTLKGLSYTMMILGAVSIAMYHPQYFKTIGDYKLSALIIPLLQVIMFGMGTELSLKDFANVIRMPKGIIIGVVGHYIIMPLVGFTVANLFNFPNEIAAGIILVGCCPSGLASNVMSYLARANLALSVSVTTISTILAPFLTPLLMRWLGGSFIEIDFWGMVWDITKIVILPVTAGLAFHYLIHGKFKWLDKAMPLLSMGGIAFIIVATFIHNLAGYFFGYWSARILKFTEKDSRTIALEVGMQNAGLASGLALSMGKLATAGLAPAIFGPVMNVTGSTLASWWHNRIPKEDLEEQKKILKVEVQISSS